MIRYANGNSPVVLAPAACRSNYGGSYRRERSMPPLDRRPMARAVRVVPAETDAAGIPGVWPPRDRFSGQSNILNETTSRYFSELKGVTGLVQEMIVKFSSPPSAVNGHVGNGYVTKSKLTRERAGVLRTTPPSSPAAAADVISVAKCSLNQSGLGYNVTDCVDSSVTSPVSNCGQQACKRSVAVANTDVCSPDRKPELSSREQSSTVDSTYFVNASSSGYATSQQRIDSVTNGTRSVVDEPVSTLQTQLISSRRDNAINSITSEKSALQHCVNGDLQQPSNSDANATADAKSAVCSHIAEPVAAEVLTNSDVNIKDGSYFLGVVQSEEDRVNNLCLLAEHDLQTTAVPDDVSGMIRAAIGKAHLLIHKKFKQFRELCDQNMNQAPGEPFRTTAQDLAGFWDMVMIQVDDIASNFDEINELRRNNWIMTKTDTNNVPVSPTQKQPNSTVVSSSSRNTAAKAKASGKRDNSTSATPKTDIAKAREEARKRLLAAKAAGRQRRTSEESEDVQIFVA